MSCNIYSVWYTVKLTIHYFLQVLMEYSMRRVNDDILLVDVDFIQQVLLDWTVWETRLTCWSLIWGYLCQSVAKDNKYKLFNCKLLLDNQVVQTAFRIPYVSYSWSWLVLCNTTSFCRCPYGWRYCKLNSVIDNLMTYYYYLTGCLGWGGRSHTSAFLQSSGLFTPVWNFHQILLGHCRDITAYRPTEKWVWKT